MRHGGGQGELNETAADEAQPRRQPPGFTIGNGHRGRYPWTGVSIAGSGRGRQGKNSAAAADATAGE
jgi:hypothetical protein